MQDFRELKVWKKAHQLTLAVYRVSSRFPREEQFGLTAQLRRAAMSIPNNIAEGCGRGSDQDFSRFLQIAMGSSCETEYLLLLARDLTYISDDDHQPIQQQVAEVKRMLSALIQTVRASG